jgi:hypothetical protein
MLGFGSRGFQDDLISSVRFHRILRRGREYGPELLPADALAPSPPNDPERGLHFVCLNANILRQFEFLQNAWIMNTKFSGLTGESDPLLGIARRYRLPDYRRFHGAWRRQSAPPCLGPATIRNRARGCLFFSAKFTRHTVLRRRWKCIGALL